VKMKMIVKVKVKVKVKNIIIVVNYIVIFRKNNYKFGSTKSCVLNLINSFLVTGIRFSKYF